MLKIKDKVDLKELEKFGFKKDILLSNEYETIYSVINKYQKLCIYWEEKTMFLYEMFESNAFTLKSDLLYDLIKAGIVEKVDDNSGK